MQYTDSEEVISKLWVEQYMLQNNQNFLQTSRIVKLIISKLKVIKFLKRIISI